MKFEVGREYKPYEEGFDPIKVVKRTEKTIWVKTRYFNCSMRVKVDADGNEYVVDSSADKRFIDGFSYNAKFVI